jgi:NAD(P)-dependent dehydrogenase (short-subunit alcohol dehydrogenase family)
VCKTLQSWERERFDYLVNNAGNSQHINFEKMTEADFDAVVKVHFKGVYYAAAKGAVESLTRYLAKELGPRRITANVVSPGPIQTGLQRGNGPGQSRSQQNGLGNDGVGAPRSAGRRRANDRRSSL